MQTINLRQAQPKVFAARYDAKSDSKSDDAQWQKSDIWLKDVSFNRGELCLVEASSGTGKSSLCSFIYGYRNDYTGTISFDADDISRYSISRWTELRRSSLSILFQELRLFGELTALENIKIKNRQTGYKSEADILSLLERLGVADKRDVRVDKLSFGQQQRVAFVRALCQPFDFIMLDEPISHLDDSNGAIMGEILMAELKERGAGAIVTSIGKHIELPYGRSLLL